MIYKEMLISYGITQVEATSSIGILLRIYVRYEKNNDITSKDYRIKKEL